MKKCLALLLCLMMLAIPAMAEGEGVYLKIYDPQMYSGDELVLDLTGISLEIGAGAGDTEASVWVEANAGAANMLAAAALSESSILACISGIAEMYKLNLADLGLDAETLTSFAMEQAELDPTAILDEFNTAVEALQPQLDAVLENAVVEENVEWPMYDADHMTTKMTLTIPSELLRGYVEAGYDLVMDLMTQYTSMMEDMGAAVDMDDMDIDMDELFAENPTIDIDIYQANDSDELISLAIYLMEGEEIIPVYVDLYTPADGGCVYVYFPIEEDDYLELIIEAYDDGFLYAQLAATEGNEVVFDINYTAGVDETEEFYVQEFNLTAEDLLISVYDHNDYATEHYLEAVINADGSELVFELLTNPTGNGAAGYTALTVDDSAILASVEYGTTNEVVSPAGAGLESVDILTMSNDDMEAVGANLENALLNFLMQAVEEVPNLQMLFGE